MATIPRRARPGRRWALVCALLAGPAAGCQAKSITLPPPREVTGGDPAQGAELAWAYGCGTCHIIPGVAGAEATVGPPLTGWAHRTFIAGAIPNEPRELIVWLMDPQLVEPGTAMPDLGVTEPQARHMAAYLFTLR